MPGAHPGPETARSPARDTFISTLWLVPTIMCCGALTWASFIYVGITAKKKQWTIAGIVYGVAFGAYFMLIDTAPVDEAGNHITSTWQSNLGIVMLLIAWLGGALHAAIINRQWLAWRRAQSGTPQPSPVADGSTPTNQLGEPWRSFVARAASCRIELNRVVTSMPDGTVGTRLRSVATQFDDAVRQCSEAAAMGERLTRARARIDSASITRRIEQLSDPGSHAAGVANQSALDSYTRQLDSVRRLDDAIKSTYDSLVALDARLNEVVTQAIELSARPSDGSDSDAKVDSIDSMMIDLTATRLALDEVANLPDGPA